MIWAESHYIEHFLTGPPAGSMSEFECDNVARRKILLALSATDTDYTADTTYLCEAWQLLLERHEPSRDIEVSDLYQKLSVATQRGRNMGDHVNECMTYRNRLKALGADCYNQESAGSQAPGPDVRACRRRSDIPVRGGHYYPDCRIKTLCCM